MVGVTLLWSVAGVVTRHLDAARSFEVTFWRSGFNAVALGLAITALRGTAAWRGLARASWPVWVSGLCWAVMFTAFMVALSLTTVANVLVTMSLSPLFTAVFARVFLRQPIPARGLIGFTNEFLNLTRGSGLISNIFDGYEPHKGDIASRKNGVLISMDAGEIFTYALGKLDDRGRMFVKPNDPVYEGMIVGIHNRDNDLIVNATRTKQLTNFRVSGKEDAIKVTPPIDLTLEYGVEFIEDDELVEITPKSVRLRKRHLSENERKRASRA